MTVNYIDLFSCFEKLERNSNKKLPKDDLKFMEKMKFHEVYIELATRYGNFETSNFSIEWNLPWKRPRKFFFEFVRNAFPIGSVGQGGLIYLLNIESSRSRVGIMLDNRELFIVVAESLTQFLGKNIDFLEVISDLKNYQPNKKHSDIDSVYIIDLNDVALDLIISLWPYGNDTSDIRTSKLGVFKAEKLAKHEVRERGKRQNIISLIFLVTFFFLAYLIMKWLEFSNSNIIIVLILFLFSIAPSLLLIQRLRGKYRRV